MNTTAYIGFGSNLADPLRQITHARATLAAWPGIHELAFSSLYRSAPLGPRDQPDYLNAVAAIATTLDVHALLAVLQTIEQQHGRRRNGVRWGPRTLDLDLLLYGDTVLTTPQLTLPHPGLLQRAFVLYPLYEIAPDLEIPGHGPLATHLTHCTAEGLQRLPPTA